MILYKRIADLKNQRELAVMAYDYDLVLDLSNTIKVLMSIEGETVDISRIHAAKAQLEAAKLSGNRAEVVRAAKFVKTTIEVWQEENALVDEAEDLLAKLDKGEL